MDKYIEDIVAIDLNCAKAVDDARKKKVDLQGSISEKRKEIYDAYAKEYEQKVHDYQRQLDQTVQEAKAADKQETDQLLQRLFDQYEENKDAWIDALVERCIHS